MTASIHAIDSFILSLCVDVKISMHLTYLVAYYYVML